MNGADDDSAQECVWCKKRFRGILSDYDACKFWSLGDRFINGYGPLCTAHYHLLLGDRVREENKRLKSRLWWCNLLLGQSWLGKLARRLLVPRIPMDDEIARAFHEAYERLAPEFGYETREASAKPWKAVPEDNKRLMIATVRELHEKGLPRVVPARDLHHLASPWG